MKPFECGVILAGGKSSRMGKDKALLPFGEAPSLTHYLYEKLSPYFCELYVSAKTDKFGGAFPLVIDRYDVASPLGALATILQTLPHERIFVLSVDTPFIDYDIIARLYRKDIPAYDAVVAELEARLQPLCGVYAKSALPTIKRRLQEKNHTLRALLSELRVAYVPFGASYAPRFSNLNRPEEYDAAQALLRP